MRVQQRTVTHTMMLRALSHAQEQIMLSLSVPMDHNNASMVLE